MISEPDLRRCIQDLEMTDDESRYYKYHAERFVHTVALIQRYCPDDRSSSILDIGPHFLTRFIKHLIKPQPVVTTMGWSNERLSPANNCKQHLHFDLNNCSDGMALPTQDKFDLVVFAETIEHVHTSPAKVLRYLRRLMKDNGDSILIIQTPNAVSLKNRVAMLFGHNPFELIRETEDNPGHFREYTMRELITYGEQSGFQFIEGDFCNYWDSKNAISRLVHQCVPSFRKGLTVVFRTR